MNKRLRYEIIKEYLLIIFQCFCVLIFFGIVMPKVVQCIVWITSSNKVIENATLVFKFNGDNNIIDNYIYLFKLFITYR